MIRLAIVVIGALAAVCRAQSPRQPVPPVRPLGRIVATTSAPISSVEDLRVLSDGRLLVHDYVGRRVLLFDSTLTHATSVIDTSSEARRAYGVPLGQRLFAYFGDSSLFLDRASAALLVIDPSGAIVRSMAAPNDPIHPAYGAQFLSARDVVFDRHGRFVILRTPDRRPFHDLDSLLAEPAPGVSIGVDSIAMTRIDLRAMREDTVAFLTKSASYGITQPTMQMVRNPLPELDRWAVLNDGTIAIVRAHDYHVDWVALDGSVTSSPRIAHAWMRLTDSLKSAFLDSVRTADSLKTGQWLSARGGIEAVAAAGQMPAARGQPTPSAAERLATARAMFFPPYVPAWMLPDYVPPYSPLIGAGDAAVSADADNELWIRVTDPAASETAPVYDIVNRQGVLVDRVQIPGATSIVGFGPGVVYLAARVGTGMQIGRARIR